MPRRRSARASSRCGRCWSRSTRRTCRRKVCSRPSATCSAGSRPRGFETRLDADLGETVIDPETAGLVYRAAQEALRNVVSHSAADPGARRSPSSSIGPAALVSCVSTTTAVASRPTRSTNEPPTATSASVRLAGLVADLGGVVTVRSAPGEGTRVEVSIPIDARLPR